MILTSRTYHRPDISVEWHNKVVEEGKPEFIERLRTEYANDLVLNTVNHDDDLTVTFTTVWNTRERYEQYRVDPILQVFWAARDAYNASVGITADDTVISDF